MSRRAKQGTGARDRLRRFLEQNLGHVVDKHQLAEVAGIHEWARRIRELRDDEGMQILTHNDRADLKPGEYLLESTKRRPRQSHRIAAQLRVQILERDGYTCQVCGRGAGDENPLDATRRLRLHIDHIDPSGPASSQNLRTLCSVCNEGRSNLALPPASVNLLAMIRRARKEDQLRAFEWLAKKFGS
jgi:5-methylcytosine-specific restriction endonuclease McrA